MSDEGEKTCPLCAEEMDLTDQQLKPCKCGYEICVWCWHHIMNMAEKDETQGRCPACRSPYNKEKIVGMAAKCERLVAEMNMEKKMKSQKAKSKMSEGRKQLSSVRVIQRNLVYIVGLPLNLADEELLQRREYFGQYGKVLKVSISRTAAGAIQHFANNTCSVYITYSKEDEAVRCIQSVHGFVLEGRALRACFGTTKYCHAWLRNVPCSNPDCLYLHEIGSQEDSFTKDEIISAYTRSRVQQITGVTNNTQRRSGNVLPAPADEYNSSTSSTKPIPKTASNNLANGVRGSPPNSSSGQSASLPAAASWGTRASNSCSPSASLAFSDGPLKQKSETCNGSVALSNTIAGRSHLPSLHGDEVKKLSLNEESQRIVHNGKREPLDPVRQYATADHQTMAAETISSPGLPATSTVNVQFHPPPASQSNDRCYGATSKVTNSYDFPEQSDRLDQRETADLASATIEKHVGGKPSGSNIPNSLHSDIKLINLPQDQGLLQSYHEQLREPSISVTPGKAVVPTDDICITREQPDRGSDSAAIEHSKWILDSQNQVSNTGFQVAGHEAEEDLRDFEEQRLKDPEVAIRTSYLPNSFQSFHHSDNLDKKADRGLLPHPPAASIVCNGYPENIIDRYSDSSRMVEQSYLLASEVSKKHVGETEGEASSFKQNAALDMGESSIISNILSLDLDSWHESLSSPQNLVKLLGDTEQSLKVASSRKVQNSSQSRFSFARQEDSYNYPSDNRPSSSRMGQVLEERHFSHDFTECRDFSSDKLGYRNGFSAFNVEEYDNFARNFSHNSSNKLSVSRTQISAPPGFSAPNRAPPPGFASHERMERTFESLSGNHLLDASSLLTNPYQMPPAANIGSPGGDIEFMDPAILAVGKGRLPAGLNNAGTLDMRSNFSSQSSAFENEARLKLLMQQSLSPLHNQRYADMGDGFSSLGDAYRVPPRIMEQSLASNLSPFSQLSLQQSRTALNGQWDGWNEIQRGNELGMTDLLRTERLGFNKLYAGYEDSKFRMPSSSDHLYNRTYGI
ncbi:hypothetical protein NMG60_11015783 [Bertholletia excelsa]